MGGEPNTYTDQDLDDILAEMNARITELDARCQRYRRALRIISGDEQCIDPTWSNETVARVALQDLDSKSAVAAAVESRQSKRKT